MLLLILKWRGMFHSWSTECHAHRSFTSGGSACGFGSDIHGEHVISLVVRSRTAACSGALADALAKIRIARESDHVALQTPTPAWEERFLKTSLACAKEAFEYVPNYRIGTTTASPAHNLQKVATNLLGSTLSKTRFLLTNFRKCLQE